MKRSFIREILDITTSDTISFAGGLPDVSLFPIEALRYATQSALQDASVFQYTASHGLEGLREKIAARYTQSGFATHPDEILITTGSQQAINLAARAYLDKSVTVELPAYLGALNVFALMEIAVDGICLHPGGVDLQQLKQSSRSTGAAYLIPDFQNPTGSCYSEAVREQTANILQENGALLIEDAAYSELYFDHKRPAISAYMPQQSLHLGSFSKILAPGLRVGWIRADTERIKRLMIVKEALDLHTATLNQSIINRFWETHGLDEHIITLREVYSGKMEWMAKILGRELPGFRFDKPKGGMFIYGSLPGVDTMKLVRRCIRNGVVFVPGAEFYPGEAPMDEIRLNFTNAAPEQTLKGLRMLAGEIY
jgi:2-aminoadipate transaminase